MRTVGFVAPSVVEIPSDVETMLSPDVRVASATLNVRNGRPGEFDRAVGAVADAVDVLVHEGATAIVTFGVPVSARQGYAAEKGRLDKIAADFGVPVVSSLAATILNLQARGAKRTLAITQYDETINEQVRRFFADAGAEIFAAVGLGARNAAEVNALTPERFYELAQNALAQHPGADSVFFSARGRLRDVAERVERETGIPSAFQVKGALWWATEGPGAASRT